MHDDGGGGEAPERGGGGEEALVVPDADEHVIGSADPQGSQLVLQRTGR
jgi:hypothetical protein